MTNMIPTARCGISLAALMHAFAVNVRHSDVVKVPTHPDNSTTSTVLVSLNFAFFSLKATVEHSWHSILGAQLLLTVYSTTHVQPTTWTRSTPKIVDPRQMRCKDAWTDLAVSQADCIIAFTLPEERRGMYARVTKTGADVAVVL